MRATPNQNAYDAPFTSTQCANIIYLLGTMLQPPLCRPYGNTACFHVKKHARFWSQEKDEGWYSNTVANLQFIPGLCSSSQHRDRMCFNQRNCNSISKQPPLFYSVAGKCGLIDFPCNDVKLYV